MNTEARILAAADRAIARAIAVTAPRTGRVQTDAMFVEQWAADEEAARLCRAAARVGPAWSRNEYRDAAAQFAAYCA